MRRLLPLLLLLIPCIAQAQNARVDDIAFKGTNPAQFAPGATVTVCTSAGNGLPCAPKVSGLCLSASDVTCNQPNPITADGLGNFGFWIAPGNYIVSITGSGLSGFSKTLTLDCPTNGTCTFTGSVNASITNKQITVGPGLTYTTIAAAQASADCPAVGCTIFVRADATLDASTITITKPIHLIFDCASYTYSGTGSFISSTTGVESVHIDGCSRSTQAFVTGTVINITNTSATGFNMTNSPSLDIEYLVVKGPGSGTGNGIYIGGTRPGLYKVLVDSFGNDGITIDGSATNTNVGTFVHTRSSHNGHFGWKVFGLNANLQTFVSCDASNNVEGFNIASSFNLFLGTDTNSNTTGYHFNTSNGTVNRGFIYSDGSDTLGVLFDAAAGGNILQFDDSSTTVTDNGSGNRYQGLSGTPAFWNQLDAGAFASTTANPANAGVLKMALTDTVCWRNNANSGNVCLSRAGASDSMVWPNSLNVGANINLTGAASQIVFTNTLLSATAPTIAGAGCGGSAASISATNGTGAFKINVGTAPTTACTVTLPAAATGWNCYATDITTNSTSIFLQKQTGAESTTSVVITNFNDVAVASNFTANDIVKVSCHAD